MMLRHTALAIPVLFLILCLALLSAGCTRAPITDEQSLSTPVETTAMQAAELLLTPNNGTGTQKSPEVIESMNITLPESNACGSPGGNQSACPVPEAVETPPTPAVNQTLDPATAYCINNNNRVEIRKNPDGIEYGVCILPDGTSCDVWEYYWRVCPSTAAQISGTNDTGAAMAPPDLAAEFCTDMGNLFEVRKNPDGIEYGVCILPDGTECDAIAYFEGTCPVAPVLGETLVDETVIAEYEALCRAKNFSYEMKTRPDGSVHGVCIFPNGRECDAQDYYVGDCIDETALEES